MLAVFFFDHNLVGTGESTRALDDFDLALLRHPRQATGQFANHLFFETTQLVDIDRRLPKAYAMLLHCRRLMDYDGRVQQRLRRNTANVEAHTTELRVALHQRDTQTQVCSAESCCIATGACPQHEHIVVELTHISDPIIPFGSYSPAPSDYRPGACGNT